MLLTCQAGFEELLARELTELHGTTVAEKGPGWVRVESSAVSLSIVQVEELHS